MSDWVVHYPQYSEGNHVSFWCPGCEEVHTILFINAPPPPPADRMIWCYDGKQYAPTISPSLRISSSNEGPSDCHVVITEGILHYQTDCKHALAGKSVPMVPWDARPKK